MRYTEIKIFVIALMVGLIFTAIVDVNKQIKLNRAIMLWEREVNRVGNVFIPDLNQKGDEI